MNEAMLKLFSAYGKSITNRQSQTWQSVANRLGISESEFSDAVDRWIANRDYAPTGPKPFLDTIRKPKSAQPGWWGIDGQHGGDWSRAKPDELAEVAAHMIHADHRGDFNRESRAAFVQMALRRTTQEAIDAHIERLSKR